MVNYCFQHDDTIVALLSAMLVHNNLSPPYAAAVMLELIERASNDYVVRVLYKNDTTREPYPLVLPGLIKDFFVLPNCCFTFTGFRKVDTAINTIY